MKKLNLFIFFMLMHVVAFAMEEREKSEAKKELCRPFPEEMKELSSNDFTKVEKICSFGALPEEAKEISVEGEEKSSFETLPGELKMYILSFLLEADLKNSSKCQGLIKASKESKPHFNLTLKNLFSFPFYVFQSKTFQDDHKNVEPVLILKYSLKVAGNAKHINKECNAIISELLKKNLSILVSKNREYFENIFFKICYPFDVNGKKIEISADTKILECLLVSGIGVGIKDKQGCTGLLCAGIAHYNKAVALILKYISELDEGTQVEIINAFSKGGHKGPILFETIIRGQKAIVRLILNHIKNLDQNAQVKILSANFDKYYREDALGKKYYSFNALKEAIGANNEEIVELILNHISKLDKNNQLVIMNDKLLNSVRKITNKKIIDLILVAYSEAQSEIKCLMQNNQL